MHRAPRLPREILSRELAYNFQGRIPERTWLKVNGQMWLDNADTQGRGELRLCALAWFGRK